MRYFSHLPEQLVERRSLMALSEVSYDTILANAMRTEYVIGGNLKEI